MKNLIVMAVAALFATNAVAAEMKWNGSAGWRYSQTTADDQLSSERIVAGGAQKNVSKNFTRAHQMRANLGVMGGWEHVEYGFGVRTNSRGTGAAAAAVNDDYATVSGNADLALGIEQAWFRYVHDFGNLDFGATIGRQKIALITDTQWETLFDNDVRWDGLGWNFRFGMFGLNAAQYVLGGTTGGAPGPSQYSYNEFTDANGATGASTHRKFQMMYSFQPYMNWKFSDDIEATLAVSWIKYINENYANGQAGGVNANATNATPSSIPAITANTFRMNNKQQWDFLAQVTLPFNLSFTGEYVKANRAAATAADLTTAYLGGEASAPELSSSALTLGLTYGKLRKAQDFTLGWAYTNKGIGSVIGVFTNDKFMPDLRGHTVAAGYALADNFHLGFKTIMSKEKERLDLVGTADLAGRSYRGAAGNAGNQQLKFNYWELTAGVAF